MSLLIAIVMEAIVVEFWGNLVREFVSTLKAPVQSEQAVNSPLSTREDFMILVSLLMKRVVLLDHHGAVLPQMSFTTVFLEVNSPA